MRKIFVASTLALALGGCALPPAVGVASLAVDVASYFFSGKTLTDHGISAIAQQDCALIRLMEGDICDEYVDFEVADATLLPLSPVDEIEIAAVSDLETSISYFAEDAQLGATDPTEVSAYSEEIAIIDVQTNHLQPKKDFLDDQVAEIFDNAEYLADELKPIGFDG
ncbi:hypothetical protein [Kiloniella sp. EL199]|uniref:hypothetical protein n=1 Tax=Kiloniella sp. EL199 TaxID=2107581 RepID=UPI000EA1893F|nr:hypothetical protein [Kiloniella sp. EL199]